MPDFAKRLIKLRKERKLTQTELANFIGVGQSLVARWESGEGRPNFDYLISLGEVLEVSFDLLLGGDSEYKPPSLKIKNKRLKVLCEKADQLSRSDQDMICQMLEKMVKD